MQYTVDLSICILVFVSVDIKPAVDVIILYTNEQAVGVIYQLVHLDRSECWFSLCSSGSQLHNITASIDALVRVLRLASVLFGTLNGTIALSPGILAGGTASV